MIGRERILGRGDSMYKGTEDVRAQGHVGKLGEVSLGLAMRAVAPMRFL